MSDSPLPSGIDDITKHLEPMKLVRAFGLELPKFREELRRHLKSLGEPGIRGFEKALQKETIKPNVKNCEIWAEFLDHLLKSYNPTDIGYIQQVTQYCRQRAQHIAARYAEDAPRKRGRPLLRVFEERMDKHTLNEVFEKVKGSYICFYFLGMQHKSALCLHAMHYDIRGLDLEDGTLIADFKAEDVPTGTSRLGYAKLLTNKQNIHLFHFLHVDEGRKRPPVSGLLRTGEAVKLGKPFFYGIATGFRGDGNAIIAVRVLWIPRITQRLQRFFAIPDHRGRARQGSLG